MVRISALVFVLLVTATTARADDGSELAQQIVRKGIRAAKRTVAIGPTIGMFSAFAPAHSDLDGAVSFGLELELYRSRLPLTPHGIANLVREKVQARIAAKAKELAREKLATLQRPHRDELKQIAREAYEEVKAELLAELDAPLPTVIRPRFDLAMEANYLFGSGDWLARTGIAIGLGPVAIGPTFSVRFGDETVARLGGELALHLNPLRGDHTVFDVFVRGDFELHARDRNDDQVVVGMRTLLDVF
ncbi:MAG: hypothetical protein ABI867_08990 [Kofleriaceae bacterium]